MKFVFNLFFGDLMWIMIGGLVLLLVAAFAWEAVAAAVYWVSSFFRRDHEPDEQPERPSHPNRSARTLERRKARVAEQRAALRAKHSDGLQ
ncbi:hypothetical protein ABZ319_11160 [Nocardia sp. NPDC005978]|uniref:hypothetical protein n=1 Tax=Nocardia sp. NPDC005978 TaxID=3156725 RepID=UPI0033BD49BE